MYLVKRVKSSLTFQKLPEEFYPKVVRQKTGKRLWETYVGYASQTNRWWAMPAVSFCKVAT